jgi:hypothetical protein
MLMCEANYKNDARWKEYYKVESDMILFRLSMNMCYDICSRTSIDNLARKRYMRGPKTRLICTYKHKYHLIHVKVKNVICKSWINLAGFQNAIDFRE